MQPSARILISASSGLPPALAVPSQRSTLSEGGRTMSACGGQLSSQGGQERSCQDTQTPRVVTLRDLR
jgi:hypothetical protein